MDAQPLIEITVLLERADIVRATRSLFAKRKAIVIATVFAVVFVIFVAYNSIQGHTPPEGMAFLFPGLLVLLWLMPYANALRFWAANKGIQEETHYLFSDQGVETRTLTSSSQVDWSRFYGATETRTDFFLYLSQQHVWAIPKRFFRSEQIPRFRELLRSQVQSRVKLERD